MQFILVLIFVHLKSIWNFRYDGAWVWGVKSTTIYNGKSISIISIQAQRIHKQRYCQIFSSMTHECNNLKVYLMLANRCHNFSYWFRIWLCDLLVVLVLAFMHNSKDPIHNHFYYCFFFNFRAQTSTNYINLLLEWTCMHTEVWECKLNITFSCKVLLVNIEFCPN